MEKKLTTGETVVVASGLVMFLFSFFAYVGEGSYKSNAWDEFPLFTYGALFGATAAIVILATKLGSVELPDRLLGFDWLQIHFILGVFSLLNSLGLFILLDDAKVGLTFALLGSIGLVVGAVMMRQEADRSGASG